MSDSRSGYGYGVVESIRVVETSNEGIGVGTVAGGVVGGLIGSQIGGGRGQTAATVAGVAGGAYVGHQIEKSHRTASSYEITIRMNDGSYQSFLDDTGAYRVGEPVRVFNGRLEHR